MRANDPATGLPFPEPSAMHKFVGWMWSKYSRKALLKIGVVTAPVVGMIAAKFGNTPSANEAIGIGLSALVLGLLDFVVSYVGKRLGYNNLESLQKLSEDQEPRRPQPAIPFTSNSGQSFTRSEMDQAIIAKQSTDAQQEQRSAHGLPFSPFTLAEAVAEADPLPFEVECAGELHGFATKTEAYIFRNQCKNDGKTANCLF